MGAGTRFDPHIAPESGSRWRREGGLRAAAYHPNTVDTIAALQQLITPHRPPRTARTKPLLVLGLTATLPVLNSTAQATDGALAEDVEDQ